MIFAIILKRRELIARKVNVGHFEVTLLFRLLCSHIDLSYNLPIIILIIIQNIIAINFYQQNISATQLHQKQMKKYKETLIVIIFILTLFLIQYIMRNGSTYENADAAMKDKLIADMKKELYELKELDHQYIKLLDQVKSEESRFSLLQDDAQRVQNQFKIKSDISKTNLAQLRNQLDTLKIQIHKYDVNIDEAQRQISNLNRINENRQHQIATQMSIINQIEKNNEEQSQKNQNLNHKIQSMKEQRNKCQAQCQRLRRALEESINNLKNYEKQARHLESSNNRHESILQIAMADREELMQGLKSRDMLVRNTQQKLQDLEKERDDLKDKTNKLEKQCIKSESDLKQVTNDLQNFINKNRDLANRLKDRDKNLRHIQGEYDNNLLEKEALRKQNAYLVDEYNKLDQDLDMKLRTIIEMQKYNEDLQKQIKLFIDSDEQARRMLNRKQAMTKLLDQVLNTLKRSSDQIAHLR